MRGRLPDIVQDLVGPAGLRSDNVTVDAELLVWPIDGDNPGTPGCDGAADG